MKKIYVFYFMLLFVWATSTAFAQSGYSKPYLVSATVYVAVDDQAELWLNGIPIGHCPHTTMDLGYKTIEAKPDSLCYFKKANILAIKLMSSKKTSEDNFVGVAYAIRFQLSDGTYRVMNSSTPEENRCFYLPQWDVEEPEGWHKVGFDDSKWPVAQSLGDMIPNTASLGGGDFGSVAGFLTAGSAGYHAQHLGERQLFRRYFSLDISANPRCIPKSVMAQVSRAWPNTVSAGTQKMSVTPVVLPARQKPLAASPQLDKRAHKRSMSVLFPMQAWPTATPAVSSYSPVFQEVNTPVATAVSTTTNSTVTKPVDLPTKVPTVIIQDDGAIVFGESSANILVTFGDGPGLYVVEAVDKHRAHLKTILNQRIMADSEMWLSWDGKDDQGNDVPVGRYYILCSKEGTVLQKILLRRIP